MPLRLGTRLTTGGHNELLYGLRAKYVVSPKDVHKMGILGIKNQAPLDLDQSVTLNGGQPVFIRPADQTKYRDTVFSYDGNRLMT